ncbi:beta-lactamase/transpeptidase-like protein [Rostrohypoxylon terebratum]|nr:beta-lactamase/transpeptidase-like protein [Rostrohypoxylon terebratum]
MLPRRNFSTSVIVALATSSVAQAALNGHCPPLGPVLPAPTNPSTHDSLKSAINNIRDNFQNLTAEFDSTGISIAVKSVHEASPLLELHHTPATLNPNKTTVIDSQTVYRLRSISKLFAALSILQQNEMKMDDIVTQFVPELLKLKGETDETNDITTVRWNEVTLGALASHMSGIGTDLVNCLAIIPTDRTQVGLPQLNESSKPGCAGVLGLPPCNRTEFFRDFGKRHPVYVPFSLLKRRKRHSRAGGFYSNTLDLLSFGTGILQHIMLDQAKTRKWMKPLTSTSSSGLLLGGPWEIIRSNNATKDKRLVEFYCKAGNLASYNNELCLVPDYDLVITILSGGPESNADLINLALPKIVQGLLPAIEDAGKSEAMSKFGGTYVDVTTNSTITLFLDDASGFGVSDWAIRDVNIIENYAKFAALSSSPTDQAISVRLYPTNLFSDYRVAWRAVFDIGTPEQLAAKDADPFWPDASCHTWGSMDRPTYGFRSLDEFIFELKNDQSARSLNLKTFKIEIRVILISILIHFTYISILLLTSRCWLF